MSNDRDISDELQTVIEALKEAGSVPPPDTWEKLVDWEGAEPPGEVRQVLTDLMRQGGQTAIHAVRILADRKETASIEPMVEVLVDRDIDKLLRDELTFAFHQFGKGAAEPLLDAYDRADEADNYDAMLTLLEAAFETGASTQRMSEALATQVEYHPAVIRRLLPEYEAADEVVALLEDRAAAIPGADENERPDGEAIQHIWNTIEQLGGEIPEALRREMRPTPDEPATGAEAYIKGAARDSVSSDVDNSTADVADTGDVGRNDPCPCGSGRKYKQCCL